MKNEAVLDSQQAAYLDDCVEALQLELVAARSAGSAPVAIEAGRQLGVDAVGATYRFMLLFDSALPEGVPVQLEVSERRWDAEVLHREGVGLLLLVRRSQQGTLPDSSVPYAQLHADPWYLIEALKDAVAGLGAVGDISRPARCLLDLLLQRPSTVTTPEPLAVSGMNPEQRHALDHCLANPVWFVWGPPGTGKTSTLGRVVDVGASDGASILVSAHSNVAVDAALVASVRAGLKAPKGTVVRAGPAVLPAARSSGLSTREIVFAKRPALRVQLETLTKKFSAGGEAPLRSVLDQWRASMSELREAEEEVLRSARIVFATLSNTVIAEAISARRFEMTIVDEVSMTYPAQVVFAASLARHRVSVFGDCRQLPPIVQSDDGRAKRRLGEDVFTACRADVPDAAGVTMLKEQYRMHPAIREVVSDFAYRGQLRDADGMLEQRALFAGSDPFANEPIVWVDVAALGAKRFGDRFRGSWFNPISAITAVSLAIQARAGLGRVVILTPYRTQARLIASLVNDAGVGSIEVGTIHRYQGSEAPGVILDLVDGTGRDTGMPFRGTSGERLLTVGLSRAQGKLIVVGDSRILDAGSLSRRSAAALSAVRQHKRSTMPRPSTVTAHNGFTARFETDLPSAVRNLRSEQLVTAWLPDSLPANLRHLDGPHSESWRGGHAGWLDTDGILGLHTFSGPTVTSVILRGCSRFAEALADAVTGSPLTRRAAARQGKDEAPTRAARHDRCNRCGSGSVIPYEATPYSVDLRCSSCHATRRASDREIGAWIRDVGPSCPHCRSAMALRKSQRRSFFGCTRYPHCEGIHALGALCDAALRPDPPPAVARPAPATQAARLARTAIDRRVCSRCFLTKPTSQFTGGDVCVDCQ